VPAVRPGDILVAHNAGPLWMPILPLLGGLILDSGSLGQHAAVTAREYGVPAVIATGSATQQIPDGAWVTIDGEAGTVEIQ
jgi:phosphohistidine swiveling domain-containing protein